MALLSHIDIKEYVATTTVQTFFENYWATMLRLITDFDGVIVDLSERYYAVYQFCLQAVRESNQPITVLPKAEFWALKRSCTPETQIAQLSGLNADQAQQFYQLRDQTAHTHPYFSLDVMIPGVLETLQQLQQLDIDLVVMTLRRPSELEFALEQYNLAAFFPHDRRYCLAETFQTVVDAYTKSDLMTQAQAELPPASTTWMIGDTEADILAAQKYDIPVVSVLSGIRDRSQLERYAPNYILPNFQAAIHFILG
jgi:phosphoglycolate phosphatase-like HAD superfamily hydrolase